MIAALVFALAGCDPAPEDIAKAIASENPVMREDGAKIAQNYDDAVVVDALVASLADPSEKVRLNAIESLAELEADAAVPALITRLQEDTSAKVRRASADALGRLQAKEAVAPLIAYLLSFTSDDHAQLVAIWAIGNIGSEGGLPPEDRKAALATLVARREGTQDKFVRYVASAALRTLK